MFKKSLSVLMAAIVLISSVDIYANSVNTTSNNIQKLIDKGIVIGDGTGYNLEKNIKRSELTKIIVYALGAENESKRLQGLKEPFKDVGKEHWANGVITYAKNNLNIINGYLDGTFKPEENISNAEVLKVMLKLKDSSLDLSKLSWPKGYREKAIELNLINKDNPLINADLNNAAKREDAFNLLYVTCKDQIDKININNKINIINNQTNAEEKKVSNKTKHNSKHNNSSSENNSAQNNIENKINLKVPEDTNKLDIKKINDKFYTATINLNEDYNKIKSDISKYYPQLGEEYYIGKIFKDGKKLLIYSPNKVLNYSKEKEINNDDLFSGIYTSSENNILSLNTDDVAKAENTASKVALFVGNNKLNKAFEATESIIGLPNNTFDGSIELNTNTKLVDGINFKLENTPDGALVNQTAISDRAVNKEGFNNLSIINNTFDFGKNSISAISAISLLSPIKTGTLSIENNSISGNGAESSVKEKIAISSNTRSGENTIVRVKNNNITDYSYNGIGVSIGKNSKLEMYDNVLNKIGENGIGVFVFGSKEINIKGNIVNNYGIKKIITHSIYDKKDKETNDFEIGLQLSYINTVYGVKVNDKYFNSASKLAETLEKIDNKILGKKENDINEGVLKSTPITIGQKNAFRNPIEALKSNYTNLTDEDIIIVKDDNKDIEIPNNAQGKTVKSILIVGEGTGKVELSNNLKITGDLIVNLPNASLKNNAVVTGNTKIENIREADESNFNLNCDKAESYLGFAPESIKVNISDITNKSGQKVEKSISKLKGSISIYANKDLLQPDNYIIDDDKDTIALKSDYLKTLTKNTIFKFVYEDKANSVSKTIKTLEFSIKNSSNANIKIIGQDQYYEHFAPAEGITLKLENIINSKGEVIPENKSNLKDNINIRMSYIDANKDDYILDDNSDTIILKKSFLDKISTPIFESSQNVKISINDSENKVLVNEIIVKIGIINQSNNFSKVKAISSLTFNEGRAPSQGITFEFEKLTDSKGHTISKKDTNLKDYLDIEPFPVDYSYEITGLGENIRFNTNLIVIDDDNDRVTFKKEYLDRIGSGGSLSTDFGQKIFIFKYNDPRYGSNFRSQKEIVAIKKALKPLDKSTKINSSKYTINSDITSGEETLSKSVNVYNFIQNINRDNPRQILRVYDKKYIINNILQDKDIYNYKNDYETINDSDILVVTAEDGITKAYYPIHFTDNSEELILGIKDSNIVKNYGRDYILINENTILTKLINALNLTEGVNVTIDNKKDNEIITDSDILKLSKDNNVLNLNIKILSQSKYRAMLVGNSDYPGDKNDLAGPVNDLDVMKKVFKLQNINNKKFESVNNYSNLNKKDFLKAIEDNFKNAKENDISYLYYSGHGNNINGISYICTVDGGLEAEGLNPNNWISVNELKSALDKIKGIKVIILDSCNAGGFIGKDADIVSSPTPHNNNLNDSNREFNDNVMKAFSADSNNKTNVNYLTSNNYKVLTASSANEFSFEDKLEKVGKFTKILSEVAGIKGSVQGDINADSKISLEEAFEYLNDNVVYTSHIQAFPRNDNFTIFEREVKNIPSSGSFNITSKKIGNKPAFIIKNTPRQKAILSGALTIDSDMTVDKFLSYITKENDVQEIYVIPKSVDAIKNNAKKSTDKLESFDRLLVINEDNSKIAFSIFVKKKNISVIPTPTKKEPDFNGEYLFKEGTVISGKSKITTKTKVKDILSKITNMNAFQRVIVTDRNRNRKSPEDYLKPGDKLSILENSQFTGWPKEYPIIVENIVSTSNFVEPDFGTDFRLGMKRDSILSNEKHLNEELTVEDFIKSLKNKDSYTSIKVEKAYSHGKTFKENQDKLENDDYLILTNNEVTNRYRLEVESSSIIISIP